MSELLKIRGLLFDNAKVSETSKEFLVSNRIARKIGNEIKNKACQHDEVVAGMTVRYRRVRWFDPTDVAAYLSHAHLTNGNDVRFVGKKNSLNVYVTSVMY